MDIHSFCSFCGAPVVRRKQARSANVQRHFCDNECKANYQRLAKPVTREWLKEHYIDKKLNCTQIGIIVNRDPKSVWNWLRDFGIPTRPRGGASSPGSFRKGQEGTFKGKHHTLETRKRLSDIAKADGRVPYDPGVGSYMKGRRGADTPGWKGGITPERQAFYSLPEWAEAAKRVWARSGAKCARCEVNHNTETRRGTFHIHHIVSFEVRELRADISNLVLLCKPCHHFVHSNANVNSEFIKEIL